MLGVGGYNVDTFIENITTEKTHSKQNSMVNTYNHINQHIGISGIGGTNGQSAWEYYDEVEKITHDDPSINPLIHLESMDRGVIGSYYYHLQDSLAFDDNNEEGEEEEEEEREDLGKNDDDVHHEYFFAPARRRAVEDHVMHLQTPALSLRFIDGQHTPTPATPIPPTPLPTPTTPTSPLSHRHVESRMANRSRRRRREDHAIFKRNVCQCQEDDHLEWMLYQDEQRCTRNERHESNQSILHQLLAIGKRLVNQNNLDNSSNSNNNNIRDE